MRNNPKISRSKWFLPAVCCASLCTLFALIPPVFYGIWHVGVLGLAGLSLTLWGTIVAFSIRCPRWLRGCLLSLIGLAAAGSLAFSIPMAAQAWFHQPDPAQPCVIIVPGARIYGDRPSLMLSYRLDRAASLAACNGESSLVVSGGRAEGDAYSEAQVMKAYLMELGIAEDRIYLEDRSTDTDENMRYSAQVIAQNSLSGQVVVSTDAFHQLRCAIFAREAGLGNVYAVSGKSPWGLIPCYWVREFCGVAHHYVFD